MMNYSRHLAIRKRVRVIAWLSSLILFGTGHAGGAGPMLFERLYDHYFPNNEYQNGEYRRWFDGVLFGPAPKPGIERHPIFYAFRGDSRAFSAFVRHRDRIGEGEFKLTWNKECLVLLLRLGDDRFSALLRREDQKTREIVGTAIDPQIDWTKHTFPRTRALYSYRYIRPSQQALQRRHGTGLRQLIATLSRERRFRSVRIYNRNDERGRILISVPESLAERDKSDLRRLVQQYIGEDGMLTGE